MTILASLVLFIHGCANEVQDASGEDASATDIEKQDIASLQSDVVSPADIQDTSSSVEDINEVLTQPADIDVPLDAELQELPSLPAVPRLDDFAASIAEELGLPGISILAFTKDEIIARGVAGVRKFGEDEPITDADRWHLGSCTKAMTATIVARLVEQGKLSFEATMADLFFTAKIQAAYKDVTVAQLLRHEGGTYSSLSQQAKELWSALWAAGAVDVVKTRREFAEAVLAAPPQHKAGTYHYSNAGYIIVGSIIESITGKSWETVIGEEVFAPLAMTCGFGAPATPGTIDAPWGHQTKGDGVVTAIDPGSPGSDNPPAFGPAGTVHCDVDSWMNYLRGHLGGGPENYLQADTWNALHATNPPKKYALGWLVPQKGILTHMGSNNMNVVTTWLYKSDGLGLLMATNMGPANIVATPFDAQIASFLEQLDQLD